MTKKQADLLEEYLKIEHPYTIMIGSEETRKNFFPAIIGIDVKHEKLVYSKSKLIRCYMKSENICEEEAAEYIDYNILSLLGYCDEDAPIVVDDISTIL